MDAQQKLRVKCEHCDGTFEADVYKILDGGLLLQEKIAQCDRCGCMTSLPSGPIETLLENQPDKADPRKQQYGKSEMKWGDLKRSVIEHLKSEGLRPPAKVFYNNIARLQSLYSLPVNMAWTAHLFQRLSLECRQEVTGDFRTEELSAEQDAKVQNLFLQKWSEWFRLTEGRRSDFVGRHGVDMTEMLKGAPMWSGFDAVLTAIVTGAWTAIETLCSDLWVAALNTHPHVLSDLTGKKYLKPLRPDKMPPAPDEPEETKEPPPKWVNPQQLHQWNYNLSRHMGDALKHRYVFTKLDSARDAYCQAFRIDGEHVLNAIRDTSLNALAAVRNVIVHRSGLADQDYLREVIGISLLEGATLNKRIPLDGKLVAQLVSPALEKGIELLHAVDQWILDNPDPTSA